MSGTLLMSNCCFFSLWNAFKSLRLQTKLSYQPFQFADLRMHSSAWRLSFVVYD